MIDLLLLTGKIADGFTLAVREGWTSVHVCHFEGELCVLPSGHSVWVHKLFGCYSLKRLEAGLSSEEWLSLIRLIIAFYLENEKCPPNQELSLLRRAILF